MSSAEGAAKQGVKPEPAWGELAAMTDGKRAHWAWGSNRTEFVDCGEGWQAVAVKPLRLGLDALTAMDADPRCGYPVVADHLRRVLYVLVPTGSGEAFAGILSPQSDYFVSLYAPDPVTAVAAIAAGRAGSAKLYG